MKRHVVVLVNVPQPSTGTVVKHAKQCIALTRLQIRHCQRQARWEGKSVEALHGGTIQTAAKQLNRSVLRA